MATQNASKRKSAIPEKKLKSGSGGADEKNLQKLKLLHGEFEAKHTTDVTPDPILSLINLHRSQEFAMDAPNLSDDESDALSDISATTWWRLLDTGPTTIGGAAAYASYIAETERLGRCPINKVRGDNATHTDVCGVALQRVAELLSGADIEPPTRSRSDDLLIAADDEIQRLNSRFDEIDGQRKGLDQRTERCLESEMKELTDKIYGLRDFLSSFRATSAHGAFVQIEQLQVICDVMSGTLYESQHAEDSDWRKIKRLLYSVADVLRRECGGELIARDAHLDPWLSYQERAAM
jgi:hypothetical protein